MDGAKLSRSKSFNAGTDDWWRIFIGKTKQEVFPQFELDLVLISVPYPGASPEEVEQGVVLAIEEAVRGVDGVKELRSTAGEGRWVSLGRTSHRRRC